MLLLLLLLLLRGVLTHTVALGSITRGGWGCLGGHTGLRKGMYMAPRQRTKAGVRCWPTCRLNMFSLRFLRAASSSESSGRTSSALGRRGPPLSSLAADAAPSPEDDATPCFGGGSLAGGALWRRTQSISTSASSDSPWNRTWPRKRARRHLFSQQGRARMMSQHAVRGCKAAS